MIGQNSQQQQTIGKMRIWYPELLHYNTQSVQFSTKNMKYAKKEERMAHSQGGKKQLAQNPPEEAQGLNFLDKTFK